MKKLLIALILVFVPTFAHAQGYVSVELGSTYNNGTLLAEMLPPANGNVGITHTFLDAQGQTSVQGLSAGKTYGFWASDGIGTNLLYGRVTVTGAPQDITADLFPVGGGSGACNIGLAGPGGIFTVSGTPAACNGVLNLTITGTSGGIPCFTDPLTLGSSVEIPADTLPKGGGAGNCVSPSSVTDSGVDPTRTPNGLNIATKYIAREETNTAPGTAINTLACVSGANVSLCPTSPAPGTIEGITVAGQGAAGTVVLCIFGNCPVLFDNQSTRGDTAIPSTTVAGELHDTGGTTAVTGENFFVNSTNSGAGTIAFVRPPGDISGAGTGLVSCLTTLGDIWGATTSGVCQRLPAPTTPDNVVEFLTSTPASGLGVFPLYKLAGLPDRTVTGTTDIALSTDRIGGIIGNNGSGIAQALPRAGTTVPFGSNYSYFIDNIGAGDFVVTPATSTINGAATLTLHQGEMASINSGDNTDYHARTFSPPLVAGTNVTLTRGAHSVTVNAALSSVACGALPALTGDVTSSAGSCATTIAANIKKRGLSFTIGAPGGTALTAASTTTDYMTIPFACTISAYNLLIDAGTITVKFWKVASGTAIPTVANSINTSGVGIATGTAIHSTTVSDFTTTTVNANDIIGMNVTATATAAFVNGVLECAQ